MENSHLYQGRQSRVDTLWNSRTLLYIAITIVGTGNTLTMMPSSSKPFDLLKNIQMGTPINSNMFIYKMIWLVAPGILDSLSRNVPPCVVHPLRNKITSRASYSKV